MLTRTLTLCATATLSVGLSAAPATAEQPRPGCGFGDDNHSHQAAPGRDPMGLRPGVGNDAATDNPGPIERFTNLPKVIAADADAPNDDPARGCPDDPRG